MKVGDKVLVEVEIRTFGKYHFTDKYNTSYNRKEIVTQLPIQEGRWMMVSDDEKNYYERRYVIGKFDNKFIAITGAFDDDILKIAGTATTPWKYAKEMPIKEN